MFKRILPFLVFVLLLDFDSGATAQIKIQNHESNSTVRYPVVLLRGTVDDGVGEVKIVNQTPRDGAGKTTTVRTGSQFKSLVELSDGVNRIEFRSQGKVIHLFKIRYTPQENPYYVRVIWMTDKSGDATYAVPELDDEQDYESRLRTAAELMQTFTAERMYERGFGRRTFRLERDALGKVIVNTFKGDLAKEDYYSLADQAWWRDVQRWINKNHDDQFAKNMVLAAYTRKDPNSNKFNAHTALGGSNLGLFGSASIYCWPTSIENTPAAFLDATIESSKNVNDDSAFRSANWAIASTTIGATLHEMGHTFGLPHVTDKHGIMKRGFDFFNRTFTFEDPPSRNSRTRQPMKIENEARFSDVSGSRLRWSRWFRMKQEADQPNDIKFDFNRKKKLVTISSKNKIPWVGIELEGSDWYAHKSFTNEKSSPRQVVLTDKEVRELAGDKKPRGLVVIDGNGNTRSMRF